MDTNNQLINQVTGDYTATDYQNISLGITDLEARPMPMPQTGHHQAANYTGNQNINMVMMPFANTPQVMPQFFTRIPIQSEEEQPMYVNAKQYHRIMKRRIAREKMNSMNPNHRKRSGYLHQSRHNHACKRPRGEGGRFLSKNSIKQQQQQQQQQQVSNGQALAAVVLSALPPLQPQPTQMQQSQQQQQQQQQSSQMQQQQQQQSPSQQQQIQQSQQLSTQQIQQQIQAHKLRSSKHSQSSSLSSSSSSSIPSPSREISPQIVSNQSDQQNMNITSTDDITSSQSVQGFQQFQSSLQQLQSPLQQLQQQFQIHTSAPDNDSKSEPTVSSGSMADNTLPPLDKDMLDNWNY